MKNQPRRLNTIGSLITVALCLTLFPAAAPAAGGDAASAAEMKGLNLTIGQKKDFATKSVGELDSSVRKVLKMVEGAQKANDLVLLNCLNDKLGMLRGAQKASSDAEFNLSEAAARENEDLVEHNFLKLYIARDQGMTLAAEAEACAGLAGSFPGQTRMVLQVDGGASEDRDYGVASSSTTRPDPASDSD